MWSWFRRRARTGNRARVSLVPKRRGATRAVDVAMRGALLAVLERDYDQAEALITDAVQADSGAIDSYLALARLLRERGELRRAIRIHQNLLSRPDLERAERLVCLAELGLDFSRAGFVRRATATFEEVLGHDANHEVALRELVRLHAEGGDAQRAIALQRRVARKGGPEDEVEVGRLWLRHARALAAGGESGAARKALRRALRCDPRSAEALVLKGELENERGRKRRAIAAWKQVPELDRRQGAAVYPRLQDALSSLGRGEDFERFLGELIERDPDEPGAVLALSRSLAGRGEADRAVALLRGLLARRPGELAARIALGRLLLAEKRDPEAVEEFAGLLGVLEQQAPRVVEEGLP